MLNTKKIQNNICYNTGDIIYIEDIVGDTNAILRFIYEEKGKKLLL